MFKLLTKAVTAVGLKSGEKLILIQIANLINVSEGQIAWPSENTLVEQAGMSRKSVGRAKQKLFQSDQNEQSFTRDGDSLRGNNGQTWRLTGNTMRNISPGEYYRFSGDQITGSQGDRWKIKRNQI